MTLDALAIDGDPIDQADCGRRVGVRSARAPVVLEADGLAVAYGSHRALSDVSFDIRRGEVFGLIGQNGAGKSTVVKTVCGRLSPQRGDVRILGMSLNDPAARAAIGVAPQQPALYDRLTVHENISVFGRYAGLSRRAARDRSRELTARVDLCAVADVQAGRLSGGQRHRANIAAALVCDPKLAILDEPCASIDPGGQCALNDLIAGLAADGLAILLITHDMTQAETLCHRVGVLADGRLVAEGGPSELIGRYAETGFELSVRTRPLADQRMLREAGFAQTAAHAWRKPLRRYDDVAAAIRELSDGAAAGCVHSIDVKRMGLDTVLEQFSGS